MLIVRNKIFSCRLPKRDLLCLWLGLLLLVALGISSLMIGSVEMGFTDVMRAIFSPGASNAFIVRQLRLPRIITAILCGGILSVSGCIVQAVIKNPLASPDILGMSTGGTLGAFSYLFFFAAVLPYYFLPIFVFMGSLGVLAILLVFLRNHTASLNLILIGIAINTFLGAIVTASMLFSNEFTGASLYIWTVGSTYGSSWGNIKVLGIGVFLVALCMPWTAKILAIHALSDDLVISLGGHLKRERMLLLVVAVLCGALATSYVGVVGFVGLIGPHCARKLISYNYNLILPMSFVIGGILTVIGDLLGRGILPPFEYPLGVFTTLMGAPYFLYILLRTKKG
ncbi:MAG: FecCD family ABC transporter permease [Spirochaetia bacterium]